VYGYGTRQKLGFGLGKYTTVFQAEVYAITACIIDKEYKNRNKTVKLQLKHLTITRSTQNSSGTAISPS
jgi:hypothetical protein